MRPVIAVDLGGTKVLACVVRDGRVVARAKTKTRAEDGPAAVLRRIADCAREAAEGAGLAWGGIGRLGIAVPGAVGPGGVVLEAPNLGWRRFKAQAAFSKLFGRPVVVANDANAGLAGERAFGALRRFGAEPVAGFFVGTGVGGAFAADGGIFTGAEGLAGELGHMTVAPDGPRCGCGNRGCLEAFASRTAIEKALGKRRGKLTSGKIRKALKKGDSGTRKAVRKAAAYLGVGVANVVNLWNPRAVVLGGGVIEAVGDFMLPIVLREAKKRALPSAFKACRVVRSSLGDDAVALGVAALALGK